MIGIRRPMFSGIGALLIASLVVAAILIADVSSANTAAVAGGFPRSLESYDDAELGGIVEILRHRATEEPMNLVASVLFFLAILHAFLAGRFMTICHRRRAALAARIEAGKAERNSVDVLAETAHFFGEVEAVFGLWVIPLIVSIAWHYDWDTVVNYLQSGVDLTEASFVVVIMLLASTRPILALAEVLMQSIARLLGGTLAALWLTILTVGPLLGSLITEPAAMTIAALLLSQKFFVLEPSNRFKYATVALLFVNISVGGTLTSFAAPPVLMVAGPWGWDATFMLTNIGWKAVVGILLGNAMYFVVFREEFARLQQDYALRELKDNIERRVVTRKIVEDEWAHVEASMGDRDTIDATLRHDVDTHIDRVKSRMEDDFKPQVEKLDIDDDLLHEAFEKRFREVRLAKLRQFFPALLPEGERAEYLDPRWDDREDPVPGWVVVVHILFMGWTIVNAHHATLFLLGVLFFFGFATVTRHYQNRIRLQPPIMVGFFLAGLIIHGGMQAWWIAPVLGGLEDMPLAIASTALTAFNDNAAITYLSTLVPDFSDGLKYSVVTGAVAGGGLTIIANAPNPAGQSILKRHFHVGVSPKDLFLAAALPTAIVWLAFAIL